MSSEILTIWEALREYWYYLPMVVMWSVLIVYGLERWGVVPVL